MIELEDIDRALTKGALGAAAARAMAILTRYGEAVGADRFISVASAHIDGSLYHGPSSIDFARRFVDLGGRVRVPTTLNVGAVDCVHPGWGGGSPEVVEPQLTLNRLHVELGCLETLTCAPYQRIFRPLFGEHVAWAESNAIVFVNSVLGARTDRYGDFTDLCAALTGRVPYAGLHREENRLAQVAFDVDDVGAFASRRDLYFAAVGYVLGARAAGQIPILCGLPANASEDELKALGASAASSGSIALFHALGVTPEAETMRQATGGRPIRARQTITAPDLNQAIDGLCPLEIDEPIAAMCVGTPHFSRAEFANLARMIEGRRPAAGVEVYVSTSREIAAEVAASPDQAALDGFGVRVVVDTCTYFAPTVAAAGAIVTNSGKYAHYGPGALRRRVGLMTLERCIRSAERGRVAP